MDAVWAVSYLSDAGVTYIQMVIDSGIVPAVIELLRNNDTDVQALKLLVCTHRHIHNIVLCHAVCMLAHVFCVLADVICEFSHVVCVFSHAVCVFCHVVRVFSCRLCVLSCRVCFLMSSVLSHVFCVFAHVFCVFYQMSSTCFIECLLLVLSNVFRLFL